MTIKVEDHDVVRLPLVGTTFVRLTSEGSTSASGVVGHGVVGIMVVGATITSTKDQHFVNVLPEVYENPVTGKKALYLSKRPGFERLYSTGVSAGSTAVHVWAGKGGGTDLITATGATNSTIYANNVSLGTITGRATFINETLIGSTPYLTIVSGSNAAYYYTPSTLTQITDADFPGNAGDTITGDFAFLNGYGYIMTTNGRLYNSDINSLSAWTAGSYISTNMRPDTGIGAIRYKNYILAFSTESIEFFEDVGNPTNSPLQKTQQAYINIGAVNQYCVKELDDTVAWVGTSAQDRIGVYMMDGLQPKKVSNVAIETLLSSVNPSGLYLNCQVIAGKTCIIVVSTSDARTYVFNVETEVWTEWTGPTTVWQYMAGIGKGVRYVYAVTDQNTNGYVYQIDPTDYVFQDDGIDYTVTIQTSKFDGENRRRKFYDKARIIGDQYDATNTVYLSWSDDDYQSFSTPRSIDMASDNCWVTHMGSSYRRAFKITQSNDQPLRLEALELELRQGIN